MTFMRQLFTILNPVYKTAVRLRELMYNVGLFKSRLSPIPCFCVGNLTTGGTGKTPMVEYVAKCVHDMGYRVGIVSRGYRRKTPSKQCILVSKGEFGDGRPLVDVDSAGDEAYLLALRVPFAAVAVCANRYQACEMLVDSALADVVIMDDGYQHFALKRKANIVLIDATKNLVTQKLLPVGDLREPLSGLRRASFIVHTKVTDNDADCYYEANEKTIKKIIPLIPQFKAYYQPDGCYDGLGQGLPLDDLAAQKVLVVAGIAVPCVFENFVRKHAASCESYKLRDHANYDRKLVDDIFRRVRDNRLSIVATTEKDWVKLEPLLTNEEKKRIVIFSQSIRIEQSELFVSRLREMISEAIVSGKKDVE